MKKKYELAGFVLTMVMIGVLFLLEEYLTKYRQASTSFFWVIYLTFIFCAIIQLLFMNKEYKTIALILMESFFVILQLLNHPLLINLERDAFFEAQSAKLIIESGGWNPKLGTGFAENYYGYNPLIHFLIAGMSLALGINTYVATKYAIPLVLRTFFLLSVFMLIKSITKKEDTNLAYFALFFYIISPRLMFMNVSRRLISAIFGILALTVLCLGSDKNKRKWIYNVLFTLFSALSVIGDHSISMLMILLYASFIIINFTLNYYLKKTNQMQYKNDIFPLRPVHFFIYIVIFIIWNVVFAPIMLNSIINYMKSDILLSIQNIINIGMPHQSISESSSVHINLPYETALAIISQGIFLMCAFFGLIGVIFIRKKYPENNFLIVFSIIGFVGYVGAGILLKTKASVASHIIFWLFSIPLSVLAAKLVLGSEIYFKEKKLLSYIKPLLLILIFSGGLIFSVTPTLYNRSDTKNQILEYDSSRSKGLILSAQWLKDQNHFQNPYLISDQQSYDVFSGMYQYEVAPELAVVQMYLGNKSQVYSTIYGDNIVFGAYEHTRQYHYFDFFVFDKKVYQLPSFLLGDPVEDNRTTIFEDINLMNRYYENGDVIMYFNSYQNLMVH
ncbi:MAG: hypothetical protein V1859_09590 [archaeon]